MRLPETAARVLAKRLVRQNTAAHHTRKASSTARTVLVAAIALVVGVLVGLLLRSAFPSVLPF